MTISVTHKKVSAVADTADTSLIQPSNWNESHDLTCAATSLLGNSAATAGAVTEIPFSTFVSQTATTGAAQLPSGTTAQRPATPTAGQIRFNATTGKFEGYGSAWGDIGGSSASAGNLPFYTSAGVLDNIAITSDSKLPFYKSTGVASNIPLTV